MVFRPPADFFEDHCLALAAAVVFSADLLDLLSTLPAAFVYVVVVTTVVVVEDPPTEEIFDIVYDFWLISLLPRLECVIEPRSLHLEEAVAPMNR